MVYQNILEAVGNTPMVRLSRMTDPDSAEVIVKYEGLNVGGSIKTRTALNMINRAEKDGLVHKDTIIVEPTSGNQGIGLALVGAVRGYKTIVIMPDSVSEERKKLMEHYGAEVRLIHDDGDIGAPAQQLNAVGDGGQIGALNAEGHAGGSHGGDTNIEADDAQRQQRQEYQNVAGDENEYHFAEAQLRQRAADHQTGDGDIGTEPDECHIPQTGFLLGQWGYDQAFLF